MINQRLRQEKEQRLEQQSRHHLSSSSTVEHRVHTNGQSLERAERHYEFEEQATAGQVGGNFEEIVKFLKASFGGNFLHKKFFSVKSTKFLAKTYFLDYKAVFSGL
jgi:hypothetical protein